MAPEEQDYSGQGRDTVIDIIWSDYDRQIFKEVIQEQNIINEISDLYDLKIDPLCGIADIKVNINFSPISWSIDNGPQVSKPT